MATYKIKMLKDEDGIPFIPLVSTQGIQDPSGETLDDKLQNKLETSNIIQGDNITIIKNGNDCTINAVLPPSGTLINNLTTSLPGQGALDAYQGKILKDSIPHIINDLTSTSSTDALSANQGYILNAKFNNYALKSALSSVATSGDYNDLVNQPDFWNIKLNPFEQWAEGVYNLNGSLNIQEDMTISGNLSVNNYKVGYEIGDIVITSTNENPASRLGGTWELVDKEFKSESINNISFFNANTSNCTIKGLYLTRNGHDIKIRFNFSNNIALSDSPINLGSFDFAGLGIIELPFSLYYLSGLTDDGNGVFIALVDYATGNLEVRDVVTKTSGGTIPSGSSCYLLFEFTTTYDMMIDSFCDKFYWKKTV